MDSLVFYHYPLAKNTVIDYPFPNQYKQRKVPACREHANCSRNNYFLNVKRQISLSQQCKSLGYIEKRQKKTQTFSLVFTDLYADFICSTTTEQGSLVKQKKNTTLSTTHFVHHFPCFTNKKGQKVCRPLLF